MLLGFFRLCKSVWWGFVSEYSWNGRKFFVYFCTSFSKLDWFLLLLCPAAVGGWGGSGFRGLHGVICFLPPVRFGKLPAVAFGPLLPASDVGVVNTLDVTPVCEGHLYCVTPSFSPVLSCQALLMPDLTSSHFILMLRYAWSCLSPLPLLLLSFLLSSDSLPFI